MLPAPACLPISKGMPWLPLGMCGHARILDMTISGVREKQIKEAQKCPDGMKEAVVDWEHSSCGDDEHSPVKSDRIWQAVTK